MTSVLMWNCPTCSRIDFLQSTSKLTPVFVSLISLPLLRVSLIQSIGRHCIAAMLLTYPFVKALIGNQGNQYLSTVSTGVHTFTSFLAFSGTTTRGSFTLRPIISWLFVLLFRTTDSESNETSELGTEIVKNFFDFLSKKFPNIRSSIKYSQPCPRQLCGTSWLRLRMSS